MTEKFTNLKSTISDNDIFDTIFGINPAKKERKSIVMTTLNESVNDENIEKEKELNMKIDDINDSKVSLLLDEKVKTEEEIQPSKSIDLISGFLSSPVLASETGRRGRRQQIIDEQNIESESTDPFAVRNRENKESSIPLWLKERQYTKVDEKIKIDFREDQVSKENMTELIVNQNSVLSAKDDLLSSLGLFSSKPQQQIDIETNDITKQNKAHVNQINSIAPNIKNSQKDVNNERVSTTFDISKKDEKIFNNIAFQPKEKVLANDDMLDTLAQNMEQKEIILDTNKISDNKIETTTKNIIDKQTTIQQDHTTLKDVSNKHSSLNFIKQDALSSESNLKNANFQNISKEVHDKPMKGDSIHSKHKSTDNTLDYSSELSLSIPPAVSQQNNDTNEKVTYKIGNDYTMDFHDRYSHKDIATAAATAVATAIVLNASPRNSPKKLDETTGIHIKTLENEKKELEKRITTNSRISDAEKDILKVEYETTIQKLRLKYENQIQQLEDTNAKLSKENAILSMQLSSTKEELELERRNHISKLEDADKQYTERYRQLQDLNNKQALSYEKQNEEAITTIRKMHQAELDSLRSNQKDKEIIEQLVIDIKSATSSMKNLQVELSTQRIQLANEKNEGTVMRSCVLSELEANCKNYLTRSQEECIRLQNLLHSMESAVRLVKSQTVEEKERLRAEQNRLDDLTSYMKAQSDIFHERMYTMKENLENERLNFENEKRVTLKRLDDKREELNSERRALEREKQCFDTERQEKQYQDQLLLNKSHEAEVLLNHDRKAFQKEKETFYSRVLSYNGDLQTLDIREKKIQTKEENIMKKENKLKFYGKEIEKLTSKLLSKEKELQEEKKKLELEISKLKQKEMWISKEARTIMEIQEKLNEEYKKIRSLKSELYKASSHNREEKLTKNGMNGENIDLKKYEVFIEKIQCKHPPESHIADSGVNDSLKYSLLRKEIDKWWNHDKNFSNISFIT